MQKDRFPRFRINVSLEYLKQIINDIHSSSDCLRYPDHWDFNLNTLSKNLEAHIKEPYEKAYNILKKY
jgi:hypothetical protein